MASKRSDLVYDAVALHSSVGIVGKREPEVARVRYGASLDLLGLRFEEIPKPYLDSILEKH